ncbi:uncharacterized protein LOC144620395 [Crassostrea virginica]
MARRALGRTAVTDFVGTLQQKNALNVQLDSLATIVQRDVAILAMEKIVTFIVTVEENFVTQQMVVGFQGCQPHFIYRRDSTFYKILLTQLLVPFRSLIRNPVTTTYI